MQLLLLLSVFALNRLTVIFILSNSSVSLVSKFFEIFVAELLAGLDEFFELKAFLRFSFFVISSNTELILLELLEIDELALDAGRLPLPLSIIRLIVCLNILFASDLEAFFLCPFVIPFRLTTEPPPVSILTPKSFVELFACILIGLKEDVEVEHEDETFVNIVDEAVEPEIKPEIVFLLDGEQSKFESAIIERKRNVT